MPEKKKQHYVPQMYMELFANSKKEFAIFNISTQEIRFPVPYKHQCYKDYFYGKDHVWEDRLSHMESEWRETLNLIRNRKTIDNSHIQRLKSFALYQRQRTFAEGQYNKQVREEMAVEYGKLICANKGWAFTEEAKAICLERAQENIAPAEHLQLAEKCLDIIDDLDVVVINYTTQKKLISSDVPVIVINPFHLHTIGYGCMGIILLFPVTPQQLVVIYDAKMYPRLKGKMYVDLDNENEVRHLNTLQFLSAEKILFAHDTIDFPAFSDDDWRCRTKNRETQVISSLGPDTQKLIATSPRKVLYDHEFSFGKVCSSFACIPFSCREAVPRTWEEGWERKLQDKGSIITAIYEHRPDVLHSSGLTKKDFRRGCQQMLKAAQSYWRKQQ